MPDDPDEKAEFAQKLQAYCVSLQQYQSSLHHLVSSLEVNVSVSLCGIVQL